MLQILQYQSKVSSQAHNQYLDYLVPQSFQGVNSLLVLSYENNTDRTVYSSLGNKRLQR